MKIAVFYGGKLSNHLVELKRAAKKEDVFLQLFSYNRIYFNSQEAKVMLRDGLTKSTRNQKEFTIADFDLIFIRTAKKHWQEVSWIVDEAKRLKKIVIDPIVEQARPTDACKAYQMLALSRAGLPIPKTLYGSLWYLNREAAAYLGFPMIIKGSGGHRGGSVYKVENQEELTKLVRELRVSEINDGRRYLAQEYIKNDGDYRVIVMGNKVLGAMKRSRQVEGEFRNNFSRGGKVEVAWISEEAKALCVRAASACGLAIAGVDLVFEDDNLNKPMFWEVNRGPQFKGFMQATGIDVPREIIKLFKNLYYI